MVLGEGVLFVGEEGEGTMGEQWLTAKEAAALWKVHPRTIGRWVRAGVIVGVNLNKQAIRVLVTTDEQETSDGMQGQEAAEVKVGSA